MSEEWRTVAVAPDYEVSNLGRVRSHKYGRVRILKPVVNGRGYPQYSLCVGSEVVRVRAHTLVLTAFVGPRPEGMVVRHWDDVRTNNALSNLLYGTPAENAADAIRNGRHNHAGKTHCKRGHEFTPDNLYFQGGSRVCRTCARAKQSRYEARKRAEVAA